MIKEACGRKSLASDLESAGGDISREVGQHSFSTLNVGKKLIYFLVGWVLRLGMMMTMIKLIIMMESN